MTQGGIVMLKIREAKKRLRDLYRHKEGFVGVGIGRRNNEDTLRVYVADTRFSVAQQLAATDRFEGFPIEIEVTGTVRALLH
jgi:hypothetical protein